MIPILALIAAAAGGPMPAFMTGCWNAVDGDRWTQECWMEPKAGLMLGASREGVGETLRSWEAARVERKPDGTLVYIVSPNGGPAVPFAATTLSSSLVEFTNRSTDYPQRIRYELKDDRLEAEISRIGGSKPVRWHYVREQPH